MKDLVKTTLAPNRIDYIVYSYPEKVRALIEDFGYEAPTNTEDLVEGIKFLIRRNKREAIVALLKLHPDRKALLAIEQTEEDNFCSACSNHSYNPEENQCGSCGYSNYTEKHSDFLSRLKALDEKELESYYQSLLQKSNLKPEDKRLSEELQLAWNHLRQVNKKEKSNEGENPPPQMELEPTQFYTMLGVVLVVGVVIGVGLKT